MSVICHHTISLDGFIAGRDDAVDWAFSHGAATSLAEETCARIGAVLGGRRWYDLAVERWNGVEGIYGGSFKGRVFVMTHHAAPSAIPRVTFLSGKVEEAVARAQDAASDKDVAVFGATLTQQCLRAGLLNEIVLHVVPVLLGSGVRLFESAQDRRIELKRLAMAGAEQVTDLRFAVVEDSARRFATTSRHSVTRDFGG